MNTLIANLFLHAFCIIHAASYVDEFYDRVLWYWVLWPRAMLTSFMTSFMTTFYDVEWVGRVPKMMSQLITWLNIEWVGRVPKMMSQLVTCLNDEWVGRVLKMISQLVTWLNVETAGHVLKWFDLKTTKSHIKMDDWFVDCVLLWHVLWPCVVILSLMAASYVDEFKTACYDMLWYWVLWSRAMLSSFMTACLDVEWVGACQNVLWYRIYRNCFRE